MIIFIYWCIAGFLLEFKLVMRPKYIPSFSFIMLPCYTYLSVVCGSLCGKIELSHDLRTSCARTHLHSFYDMHHINNAADKLHRLLPHHPLKQKGGERSATQLLKESVFGKEINRSAWRLRFFTAKEYQQYIVTVQHLRKFVFLIIFSQ